MDRCAKQITMDRVEKNIIEYCQIQIVIVEVAVFPQCQDDEERAVPDNRQGQHKAYQPGFFVEIEFKQMHGITYSVAEKAGLDKLLY